MATDLTQKVLELSQLMNSRKANLALAESCTGGLLSAAITSQSGVSSFYQGAVVSYAAQVKRDVLGVSMSLLKDSGEVSEPVAEAMAQGVCKALSATWSIAITGVAGPNGGTKSKPVGTVCFAVAGPSFVSSNTQHFTGSREQIQFQSCSYALESLINIINNESEN